MVFTYKISFGTIKLVRIASQLVKIQTERGLTAAAVFRPAGVTAHDHARLAYDLERVRLSTALRVARALGLPADALWYVAEPSRAAPRSLPLNAEPYLLVPKKSNVLCGLRAFRRRLGLRVNNLKNLTGVGAAAIAAIERGRDARVGAAVRLAGALEARVSDVWVLNDFTDPAERAVVLARFRLRLAV